MFRNLSSFTKEVDITRNGLVEGYLLNNKDTLLPIISVVVLEWNNYLPVLAFLPLTPHWIWILDPHWKFIYARLFPDCVFINGFNISLPAVDIEKSVVD